jgi:hypothetical protein
MPSVKLEPPGGQQSFLHMNAFSDFVIQPTLHVRGEPNRGIASLPETRRSIRTLDEATAYVREHKEGRNLGHRERVLRRLEGAASREEMLDAVNTFRAWLEAENLLFPNR